MQISGLRTFGSRLFVCQCVNHFCGEGSLIQQPNQKGYSNDPQKYKGYMIEKVNIGQVMNQYQIVTDADHVYVEKGNSQGKINKSDLISKLLAASELDKIKIISQIDFISDINEKIFISNMKDNVLLYYKYKQKSPFVLIIIVNYEKKELVLEFTGKILLESYKELIHRDNLRQCLDSINKMGICTLDVDSIITHGIVAKCDVTKDVKVDNFPMIVRYCRQQLKNYRKWICKNYENGVIIENIVKTLRYKKRFSCCYFE